MKKTPTISIIVPFLVAASLLFGVFTAEAARDRITVEEGGVSFKIDCFDDGRSKPYRAIFTANDVRSTYNFDADGFVTNINTAGSEKYKVLYRSNGDLKRVDRTSSRRRTTRDLADKEVENENEVFIEELKRNGRRLYACSRCADAWDAICDHGVPSVCALMDYGSPLSTVAQASIVVMCETFGDACARSTACEACEGQCEEIDDDEGEGCGDACGTNAIVSDDDAPCTCPDGFIGDPLVSCTTSDNACLDITNEDYRCSFDGTDTTIQFLGCDLVDADVDYLPACFDNFGKTNVKALVFTYNSNLNSLPEDVFSGLSELTQLNLINTRLASLPQGLLSDLTSLTALYIHLNGLTTLPSGVFSSLINLKTLWLDNNHLTTLPEGLFSSLVALDTLGLSGNNDLQCLPTTMLSGGRGSMRRRFGLRARCSRLYLRKKVTLRDERVFFKEATTTTRDLWS